MTKQPLRIVIADDHLIIASAIADQLQNEADITVVGIVHTYDDLLAFLAQTPVDVVILDIQQMHGSPYTTVQRIRRDFPDVRILVLSASADLATELRQAGAHGYLSKAESLSDLLDALRSLWGIGFYMSPVIRTYFERSRIAGQQAALTEREMSVLKLLAHDYSTEETARELSVSPTTIQKHVASMLGKLGFNRRKQLFDWYRITFGDPNR